MLRSSLNRTRNAIRHIAIVPRLRRAALLLLFLLPVALPAFDDAESDAILQAAGFEVSTERWVRCHEDLPTMSYSPGAVAEWDLNQDGTPEAFVTEHSVFCYGNTGAYFVVLAKNDEGLWYRLLEGVGVAVELEDKTAGWSDIEVGGPGAGPFPTYRFDGDRYVPD